MHMLIVLCEKTFCTNLSLVVVVIDAFGTLLEISALGPRIFSAIFKCCVLQGAAFVQAGQPEGGGCRKSPPSSA